ncbi:MAG: zf-HC2 domain-containing protein [Cytophagales bacterium]|nr:zf-HC2 domain-containing protein [Cytophagales bacterium]
MKSIIPLHRTCKEATHLMLSAQDQPLSGRDRIALEIHLWMCDNCPRFERQLKTIRRALSDWRNEMTK